MSSSANESKPATLPKQQVSLEESSASKPLTAKGFVLPRVTQPKITEVSTCSHQPQCTLRQPLPPPLPSVTYLVNHSSMYHQKLQEQGGVEHGGTHDRCMAVEYERYGCADCMDGWKPFPVPLSYRHSICRTEFRRTNTLKNSATKQRNVR